MEEIRTTVYKANYGTVHLKEEECIQHESRLGLEEFLEEWIGENDYENI